MSGDGGGRGASGHYKRAVGWNLHGRNNAGLAGSRIGCAADFATHSAGVDPRLRMRAIAPEKDGDGRRCESGFSTGDAAGQLMAREGGAVVGWSHRGDDQRVSTRLCWEGRVARLLPGASLQRFLSPPSERGTRSHTTTPFRAFTHQRAAPYGHAIVRAMMTHSSRACSSSPAFTGHPPRSDEDSTDAIAFAKE